MRNQLRSLLAKVLLPLSLTSPLLSPLATRASEDPDVGYGTHNAMGCMLVQDCTDGVRQVLSMQDVREHFGEGTDQTLYDYDPYADEFNAIVAYLYEAGVKLFFILRGF